MSSSDSMPWARLSVTFADNPKVAGLSDGAFRTLVEMILWARQELTDGVIPASIVHRRWNAECIAEIEHNHRERPSLTRNEDGDYVIRDFLEHQESRERVSKRKAQKTAAARQRWAKRKASENAPAKQDVQQDAMQPALQDAEQNRCTSDAETETETDITIPHYVRDSGALSSARPHAEDEPTSSKARGSRLPEDWEPSPNLVEWTRANAPAAASVTEVEKFRDYWQSQPGARGRKVSWDATWRNWARRCQESSTARGGYRNQAQIMADIRAEAAASTADVTMQGNALRLIEGAAS
ncbi:hypothetical protein [Actinomyces faecalis]|uniref:hypothetical protein n=1 Tax=Actinomyces faecalis TaxID=2722820 RepID=UPI001556B0EE|nr:hypothetical protein [Actinomyces faecalis]